MGQVTIYLNDETESKMKIAAKSMKISKSKWISKIIEEKVSTEWPLNVHEMAGSWNNFPNQDEIRSSYGEDAAREDI